MRTTIVILVMALGLIGWWSMSPADLPPPPPPGQEEVVEHVDDNVTPDVANAAVESSANRTSVGVTSDVATNEAPELPGDDAEWIEVKIVMRDSGEPVASADVMWTNQTQLNGVNELPTHEQSQYYQPEKLARRFGWRTRSDENGMVRVVAGKHAAVVFAEKDGLYGMGRFDGNPPPRIGHRVEIEPDLTLRVKVLTANDEPARDVPLSFINHDPDKERPKQRWWYSNRPVRTDANGIAAFPHMQTNQRRKRENGDELIKQWLIYVRSAGLDMEPAEVDAQSPPAEPVEMRLPASGHVRVRLVSGGEPLPPQTVRIWPKAAKDDPRNRWMVMSQGVTAISDEDGWFEYRHVGLRKTYTVSIYNTQVDIVGPVMADETVERTINLDEHAIVVAGRVLRPDDEPLANKQLKIQVRGEKGVRNEVWVRSQPNGEFVALINDGQDGKPIDRASLQIRWDPNDQQGMVADLPPRVLHVGRTDLGDVKLSGATLIVSGQIVPTCEVDNPCSARLERMRPPRREGQKPSWRGVYDVNVHVEEDLSFAAYGMLEPGRYRLRVYGQDFVQPDPVEFSIGARDIRVPVTCGNQLDVHCLLPVPLKGARLDARLKTATTKGEGLWPMHRSRGEGEADYTWSGLADGIYTLELRPKGWGRAAPFHRIAGIRLPLDGSRIGTLADVDLRGKLAVLELELQLEGRTEGSGYAFLMPQESDTWQAVRIQCGKNTIPVPAGANELFVAAERFEPVTLSAVQGATVATLRKRPVTQVSVAEFESLKDDYTLRLTAKPKVKPVPDKRRYRSDWSSDPLRELLEGTTTSATIRDNKGELILGAGAYTTTIRLRHRKTRRSVTLKNLTPGEIAAGGAYQLSLDPAELQQAMEKASKPRETRKTR